MVNVLEAYCDGGCRGNQYKENVGGWGAVLKYKEHTKEVKGGKKNTTNNEMEITACIEALKLIKLNFRGEVHLYTDSNYVYKCMTDGWYKKWQKNNWRTSSKKPVENKDLWVNLIDLVEKINPIFHKVEGHSGVELNEKADALANLAMDELEKNNKN
jgi:ribonuclease HI